MMATAAAKTISTPIHSDPLPSSKQITVLNNTYRDPESTAYMGGIHQLYAVVHKIDPSLSQLQVKRWLLAQDSYALAPPMRYKVEKEKIIVYNRFDLGACDLAEFQPLSRFNNGINFLFVYRNCFSKRISVGLLHNKTGEECARVFRNLLVSDIKFIPRTLVSDHGGEFLNPHFREVCAEFKIKMFQPRIGKAVHAENAILYLKTRLYRYMRDTGSKRYIDILPRIVANYNDTVRPVLGITPNEVGAHNQFRLFHRMFGRYLDTRQVVARFSVGDIVRIKLESRTFEKSYFHKYSTELYKIIAVLRISQPPKYDVQALQDPSSVLRLLERELLLAPQSFPTLTNAQKSIGLHARPLARKYVPMVKNK